MQKIYNFFIDKNNLKPFVIGFLTILTFAPFKLFFLSFVIYSYLAYIIYNGAGYKKIFFFFLGSSFSQFYWISFSFLVNSSFTVFFPFAFLIIPSYFALIASLFFYYFFKIINRFITNTLKFYLAFCLCFFLYEILRSFTIPFINFNGFPWNLSAYSLWSQINILQILPVIGTFALSLMSIFLYSSFFFIFTDNKNLNKIFSIFSINCLILATLSAYGKHKIFYLEKENTTISLSAKLIHTNDIKHHHFDSHKIKNKIDNLINIANSDQIATDLIIFPEGGIPYPTEQNKNEAFRFIASKITSDFNDIIVNSPRIEQRNTNIKYYNSLFLLDKKGNIKEKYDKKNLVAFGEYIPYLKILPKLATKHNFSAGKTIKNIKLNKISFTPLLCFDSIFQWQIPKNGDLLINITNDIWFTKKLFNKNISTGPWQHFQHSRYRAIENRKPLIRVSNYGITAFVNKWGKVIKKLDFYDKAQSLNIKIPL